MLEDPGGRVSSLRYGDQFACESASCLLPQSMGAALHRAYPW